MTGNRTSQATANNTSERLAALPDVVLVLDGVGRIDFASAGSTNYLGARPRDWVGLSALARIHPNDVAPFVDRLDLAQSGQATPTQALSLRVLVGDDQWQAVAARGFVQIDTDGLAGTLVMFCNPTGTSCESQRQTALDGVFNVRGAQVRERDDDRAWITELLPLVLSNRLASGPLSAVIVMTLADDVQRRIAQPSALENSIGALAQRVREILRPRDVLTRLGTSQLVIVCPGLTECNEGFELVHRLHQWCSAITLGDACGASQVLTTGCAFATADDNPNEALDFAASPDGRIESGQFALVAT